MKYIQSETRFDFGHLHGRHGHHSEHMDPSGDFGGRHHQGGGGPGRRGRGFGFGDRGGRARRGGSKYLLMDALRDSAKNGYDIIKWLEEKSNGRYGPSPGVVYPTLQLLEDAGQIVAEQVGERRVYNLTESGKVELDSHTEEVAEFWLHFTPPSEPARAEVGYLAEELEHFNHAVWGALRGVSDGNVIRQVRQAVENCRNEVRSIVSGAKPGDPDQ